MNLSNTEQTYFDGLLKWVELTKGEDGLKMLADGSSIPVLMQEYNEAYIKFFEKYVGLFGDQKKAINEAMCIKTYHGIKINSLIREENLSIKQFINSL